MSRRAAALLSCLLLLLLALAPWTVTSERVKAAVARQLRNEYGLRLDVQGQTTISLLPVPRIKLSGATLSDASGRVSVSAGQLKGEFRLAPLFAGQLRISDLRIVNARIDVAVEDGDLDSPERRQWWAAASVSPFRVDRVVVTGSRIVVTAPGIRSEWRNVTAVLRWPDPGGSLDLAGSGDWRGENVSLVVGGLSPAKLLSQGRSVLDAKLTSRLGTLNAVGDLAWGSVPRFSGLLAGQAPSLGAVARWTGLGLDLQDLDIPLVLSGDGSLDLTGFEWPRAVLDLGRDRLEGAIGYRWNGGRPHLQATLAGDALDLGWILPLADPGRVERPLADYDVRLSGLDVRIGPLRLGDVATGILVSGERLEVSLARATLAGGSIRGRVSAALDGDGRDIRGQLSLDRVDLDKLPMRPGPMRGLTGTFAGQASFEAIGELQPEILRHLRGRLVLSARDGEIDGVSLGEPARRPDARARGSSAGPDWRGGKTRYGQAGLTLDIANGVAGITEGTIQTPSTQTSFTGSISLLDGSLVMQATTRASPPTGEPSSDLVLDVRGSLDRPMVVEGERVPTRDAVVRP